ELEYHPDNAPPNDVLLAPLGLYEFKRKYPGGAPNNPAPTPLPYTPPASGLGCWRRDSMQDGRGTPRVTLAQAEANARSHYAQLGGQGQGPLAELATSRYVNVDINGPSDDLATYRDAWYLMFRYVPA